MTRWFSLLITLTWFSLLARLVSVGVINHDYYRSLAAENRIKLIPLPAERGKIYDRLGEVISGSQALAHAVGYTGAGEGETVGRDGLEKQYDGILRGKPGGILAETDAGGQIIREIGRSEPVRGQDLSTTLDAGLSRRAADLLAGRKGAVVAFDPQNGAVRALVSSPGFNPDQVAKALDDPALPLFNRAIGGVYPPGSVFKIITAAAALEEHVADEDTKIEDTGVVKIGDYSYSNWYFTQYGRTEGSLDIVGAVKRSNDIFFYRLGEALGARRLADWAKFFGLGWKTGIDLAGEAGGLMPDPEWKEAVKKEPWYLGDTIISAIGQGDILMTPLQVNLMTSVIASGGKRCRPFLAGEADCKKLDISPKTIELITKGMSQVTKTGGTAFPFFNFPVPVAGKTGTAEYGDPQNKTHAWFTGFVLPAGTKAAAGAGLAVTVLLEGAGEGSYQAAPVAKELFAYWFGRHD